MLFSPVKHGIFIYHINWWVFRISEPSTVCWRLCPSGTCGGTPLWAKSGVESIASLGDIDWGYQLLFFCGKSLEFIRIWRFKRSIHPRICWKQTWRYANLVRIFFEKRFGGGGVLLHLTNLLLADGTLNLWQLDFLKLWASWIISDHGPPTCEYHHWSRHETCCPMTDPVQLLIKIPLRKVVKIRLLNYETEPEKATASWKYRYICIYIYINICIDTYTYQQPPTDGA